ncbi:MAG: AhpC/TSA family protein [Caulobacteraceae bacterium]|nr:AhpC/TSA family protein [Caulobacteraceae bacterium]
MTNPADPITEILAAAVALDAPLEARLRLIQDAVAGLNPSFSEGVERMVARLATQGAGSGAPSPGDLMPSFLLPDETGRLVSLSQLLREGPVVVAFHRGHWCPYCRLHAIALGEVRRQVELAGARIVAIAPDRRKYNALLQAEAGGDVSILSDIDNGYALSLNLAIWVGEEMEGLMRSVGYGLDEFQGANSWMLPIPATFIIDTDGRVAARHIDPDYRRRMDVELLLEAVRALRQAA